MTSQPQTPPAQDASAQTSTTVDHDGLTFDVRTSGPDDGVPVVLLHGFPQTSLSWAAVTRHLEGSGLRLVAPDQRGYSPGARPDAVEAYDIDPLVGDVLAVADDLGLGAFHVVAHDWGASVAWALAARHPDRVATLTALSIPHLAAFGRALVEDEEQQRSSSYIKVFRRTGEAEDVLLADDAAKLRRMYGGHVAEADVEAYVELFREGGLTPALSWYRAMRKDIGDLPNVRVPTTYVWGEQDLAVAGASALACGDHVDADYRFVRLPGASHWLPDEVPEVVAEEVRRRVLG